MLRYATVWFPFRFALIARTLARAALLATVLLAIPLPGQAQSDSTNEIDPWEGYNRWMFNFNDGADRLVIKPVARGYDFIMPEVARIGVNNFFTNFYDFNGALNALLQGEVEQAFNNTFRVLTNSTIGLFGLFDVASAVGIP
ncbi:MAG: MlaA family lipoprotein, partial [Halieaceae bacterium]